MLIITFPQYPSPVVSWIEDHHGYIALPCIFKRTALYVVENCTTKKITWLKLTLNGSVANTMPFDSADDGRSDLNFRSASCTRTRFPILKAIMFPSLRYVLLIVQLCRLTVNLSEIKLILLFSANYAAYIEWACRTSSSRTSA